MPVIELGAGLLGLSVHGPCVDENGDEVRGGVVVGRMVEGGLETVNV